ncbi:MAG TPA: helix-turn-helix domain-containing protein, partial [Planctomycetota bacterium]|nr:helix-turn-helix domain-containing protein [Planctomycetota bacterium]
MSERHLTFSEVQQMLGLSADEVRGLMESKSLHGVILDGVIQFPESEVRRLRGASGGAGTKRPDETGFTFLVDEDEEAEIEGQAYDGEELVVPTEPAG